MQRILAWRVLMGLLILITLLGFEIPAPAHSQAVETGYWFYLRQETPPDTWVGSEFRGMPATWEPVYTDESIIGGIYQETNKFGSGKEIVWLTEKATCAWTWGEEMPGERLEPLDVRHVVATVDASADGPGTVYSGGIANVSYGPASSGEGWQGVAFAQANIDKLSQDPASATKEQEGIINVPTGKMEGELMAIELSCSVANGLGKVFTRWIYQWKVEKQALPPAQETAEPRATATRVIKTPGSTPTACPVFSPQDKLRRILAEYHRKIPDGIHPFGVTNNIVSVYSSKMDKWTFGAYQDRVLGLLNELRFNSNPCIADLMTDWDYGPIQAFYGGHQAVVIYPHGSNWMTNGIVLDPWIRQTAKAYSINSWLNMMTVGFRILDRYPGIGPSNLFSSGYPTHGSSYVTTKGLTRAEAQYVAGLPEDQQQKIKKLDLTEKKEYLNRIRQRKIRGTRLAAHCPLDFYVQDAQGSKTGMVNGEMINEVPEVLFLRIPLQDGTYWTQIEYNPEQVLKLVMQGTGSGSADLFIGLSQFNEDPALDRSEAFHLDVRDGLVFTLPVIEGAPVESEGVAYAPVVMDEQTAAQISQNLSQPDLSMLEEVYAEEDAVPQVQASRTQMRLVLVGLLCCTGAMGLVLVAVIVFFVAKKMK
jgi:hypothetical protein